MEKSKPSSSSSFLLLIALAFLVVFGVDEVAGQVKSSVVENEIIVVFDDHLTTEERNSRLEVLFSSLSQTCKWEQIERKSPYSLPSSDFAVVKMLEGDCGAVLDLEEGISLPEGIKHITPERMHEEILSQFSVEEEGKGGEGEKVESGMKRVPGPDGGRGRGVVTRGLRTAGGKQKGSGGLQAPYLMNADVLWDQSIRFFFFFFSISFSSFLFFFFLLPLSFIFPSYQPPPPPPSQQRPKRKSCCL